MTTTLDEIDYIMMTVMAKYDDENPEMVVRERSWRFGTPREQIRRRIELNGKPPERPVRPAYYEGRRRRRNS